MNPLGMLFLRLARVAVPLATLWTTAAAQQLQPGTSVPLNLRPFSMDHRRAALQDSPVSVSFLLDAPSGKHGFVVVRDGHLATEDGKRDPVLGSEPDRLEQGLAAGDAAYTASTLARFGINSVRFQFLDLEVPRGLLKKRRNDASLFDQEAFDREDYFLAELERRGIYLDFNLLVGRPFRAAEGVSDADHLREGAKGVLLYDARMIELQRGYARQLLTHLNPYTNRTYTEDPAVAIVEINNENSISPGFQPAMPFYRAELSNLYMQWLAAHRTPAQVAELRAITGAPPNGNAPLLERKADVAQSPPERFYAEAAFYNDLERDYFLNMEGFLKKSLKLRSLVLATADHSHASSGYPILLATQSMDIIDGHTYWQHPESYVTKLPMVDDPRNSTLAELARSAITGKPYTVSEVNNPFPNDYAGEGIPILAAYAGLQDWDAIFWYTFEPKRDPNWQPYVGDPFDLSLDPLKMPELAAAALEFLRADVATARSIDRRSYTERQVFDSMLLPSSERPFYTPGLPPELPLEHEVRIASLAGPPTQPYKAVPPSNPIQSDTGELRWFTGPSSGSGLVTVDTPRTQELVGFLNNHPGASTRNLTAQVDNAFCTIMLSAMDGRSIAWSTRLLLIAGGPVENSRQRWNSANTDVTDLGRAPTLVEPVTGTITLRGLEGAKAVHLQAIDGAGQIQGNAVTAEAKAGGEWRIPLGALTTTWYRIEVER